MCESKPHAVEQLSADLINYNVDIAAVTETHLKAKHTDSIVAISGYTLHRRDRTGRKGGGVCRALSLSDRRYSLNPLSQTRID